VDFDAVLRRKRNIRGGEGERNVWPRSLSILGARLCKGKKKEGRERRSYKFGKEGKKALPTKKKRRKRKK